jgi:hypothetical protein
MPPQRQRVLGSGGRAHPVSQRRGKEAGPVPLFPEQLARITPGPVQQRELDHQLGPDVPAMHNGRAQPLSRGGLASRGRLDQRAGWALAGVLLPRQLHQAEPLKPLHSRVDRGLGNLPDPAQAPVMGKQPGNGETMRRLLTDNAQDQPVRLPQLPCAGIGHDPTLLRPGQAAATPVRPGICHR